MTAIRRAFAGARGWVLTLVCVLTLGFGLARCGDDPILITAYSETISATDGGTMEFLGVILIFEPGDLASDTEITITYKGQTPQKKNSFSSLFEFEPAGLIFAGPVRLCFEFRAPTYTVANVSGIFWTNLGSESFSRETYEEGLIDQGDDNWLRCAEISHFSQGYLGNNTLNPNGPSDADLLFQGIGLQQYELQADDRNESDDDTFTDGEDYQIVISPSGSVQLRADSENIDFQFDPNLDRFESEFTGRVAIPPFGLMATIYRSWGTLQIIRVSDDNPQFCLMLDEGVVWDFPEDGACVDLEFGESPTGGDGGMMPSAADAFFAANATDYAYVADERTDVGNNDFTHAGNYTVSVTAGGTISITDDQADVFTFTFGDEGSDIFDESGGETNVIMQRNLFASTWQIIMSKPTGMPVEFYLAEPTIGGADWVFSPPVAPCVAGLDRGGC